LLKEDADDREAVLPASSPEPAPAAESEPEAEPADQQERSPGFIRARLNKRKDGFLFVWVRGVSVNGKKSNKNVAALGRWSAHDMDPCRILGASTSTWISTISPTRSARSLSRPAAASQPVAAHHVAANGASVKKNPAGLGRGKAWGEINARDSHGTGRSPPQPQAATGGPQPAA
jgi:hypothetical protein